MSFADLTLPNQLMDFLELHRHSAYAVLFLGAFFETLIPFSLAILGEIFFLSGAILAGLGILDLWAVTGVLYLGGILGDNASYWIGRRYGQGLFDRLSHLPWVGHHLHAENYRRGIAFFRHRGAFAVLAARFSGPLSWVMPALAGVFRLDYLTFVRFNTLAVVLGIGQFILLGYFFGTNLEAILDWLDRFGLLVFCLITGLSLIVWRFFRISQTN